MSSDTGLVVVRRMAVLAALAVVVAAGLRIEAVAGTLGRIVDESLPVLVVAAVIGMTVAGRQILRDGTWSASLVRSMMVLGWVLGGVVILRRLVLSMGLV